MKNKDNKSPTDFNPDNDFLGSLTAKLPDGIKKLNNLPYLIVLGVAIIFLVAIIWAIGQRGGSVDNNETTKITIKKSDANTTITDIEKSLWGKDKNSTDTLEQNITIAAPENNNTIIGQYQPDALDQAAAEALAKKFQSAEEAKWSATHSQGGLGSMGGNTATATNTYSTSAGSVEAMANQLGLQVPKLDASPTVMPPVASLQTGSVTQKRNKENNDFVYSTQKSYDYLPYQKSAQLSKFELKTGSVIPGIMISGVNSELPGMIIGQVSENIYDSATGHYLIIPQGTRLVGQYSADVQYGQNRVMIAWNRLVFPDGKTLNIEAMYGTDQAGYAGFADKVNNHYFKIFGTTALLSILGGELSFKNGQISINDKSSASGTSGLTTFSQVSNTMLNKNLEVAPTIEIRPGYRFNIFVAKDMMLEPLSRAK